MILMNSKYTVRVCLDNKRIEHVEVISDKEEHEIQEDTSVNADPDEEQNMESEFSTHAKKKKQD